MKFKQVEVSAFRIYNKPEDATFDFTTDDGDIANFVSLYAPNGFGKTSFYDAIEWGVTNNVQRFWQNKNTQESINALRASTDKQVKLLRNNNSKAYTKTYVKITTDSVELPSRVLKVHGSRKTDIDKDENVENLSFRQVILSQEWISAFLKEVDGERRYQIFMQNPDLVEIDNYYKGVKVLFGENQKMIESFKQEIKLIKLDINPDNKYNPLETINYQIKEINEELTDKNIGLIKLNASKEQIKDFKDFISGRIISHSKDASTTEILSQIKKAKIGDTYTVGLETYYVLNKDLKLINKELTDINVSLKKFKELDKTQNKLTNNKKNISDLNEKESEHKKVLKNYDYYNTKKEKIEYKRKRISSIEKEQLDLSVKIEELTRQELTTTGKIENLIKQKVDTEDKEKKIPGLISRGNQLKKDVLKLELLIDNKNQEIEKVSSKINSIGEEINELEKVKIETNKGEYSLLQIHDKSDLINLTNTLKKYIDDKEKLSLNIKELNEKIKQQKSLNTTIEEFIKSGLTIANDLQNSTCPLCEYQYNSYKELADRISNNKALNTVLKELLSSRNKLNEEVNKNTVEINEGNKKLIKFYDEKIDRLIREKKVLKEKQDGLIKSKKKDLEKLLGLRDEVKEISVKLKGLTHNKYKKQLNDLKLKVSNDFDILNKQLTKIKKELLKINEKHKNNVAQTDLVKKENEVLEKDEKYIFILNWLKNNLSSNSKTKEKLQEKVGGISSQIENTRNEMSELEKLISDYEKELSSLKELDLLKGESDSLKTQNEIEQKIQEYTYFIKDKFGVEIENFDQASLVKFLNEKESEFKKELKKHNGLKAGFLKLEKYAENLYPFLQSEKAKQNLKKKEEELDYLEGKVNSLLKEEKEKTRKHIDEKIRDFFYENLTNDIYRKIDPHPDFKSVKFMANFESNNPRLDIFVKNQNDKESLIPNLYFSTAQINILSLSIFLASALNSDEYDCIFIDDPIQSMDSINVLSTIDLIRGIIVNNNKQIILSTHDENFFNLLKKKIPNNIFKSKFLELETFGKLKKENDSNLYISNYGSDNPNIDTSGSNDTDFGDIGLAADKGPN